jgi:hypothetical protein
VLSFIQLPLHTTLHLIAMVSFYWQSGFSLLCAIATSLKKLPDAGLLCSIKTIDN